MYSICIDVKADRAEQNEIKATKSISSFKPAITKNF